MKDGNQRKSGAVLSYFSIIASTLVQLLYTPLLIRMLGQSEYGLYSLVASVIGYLTVLDLGFGNAIVVYTAKYRACNEHEKEQKLQGMFKIIFYIIGVVIVIVGLSLYFNVQSMFGNTMSTNEIKKTKIMMLILCFNLIVTFSFNIYSSIINAYERFVFQKIMSILNTILKPVLMIPLLFLGFKSVTMCLVITGVNIFVVLSNYFYCKKKLKIKVGFRGFDKQLFCEIFSYSFFIFLGALVDKANWSIDQFILGAVSGTIAVSIYSVASQLNTLFINLSTAISGVLLPKMSKMVAQNATTDALTEEMIKVGRIQYYIIYLMATGLILIGKEFIEVWAGKGFEDAYYVALILIIPLCIPLIQNLGISIMQAMNRFRFKAISTSIMAIFNVIISYHLAKKYGAIGAAFGTAVALVICNIIIMNIYYAKALKLNMNMFWRNIIKMTIIMLVPFGALLLFKHVIYIGGLKGSFIYGALYSLLYSVVVYLLVMNKYEKKVVSSFIKKCVG